MTKANSKREVTRIGGMREIARTQIAGATKGLGTDREEKIARVTKVQRGGRENEAKIAKRGERRKPKLG